jgi:hypothetical protein
VVKDFLKNVFRLEIFRNIFFIFKNLFLILAYQNSLKTLKKLKQRKKIKIFEFSSKKKKLLENMLPSA